MKIIYASNNRGKRFGNYDAGELKRDMITWDDHHLQKFSHLFTGYGTWQYGNKMKGKKLLRQTLLETYQDRRFHDPHPNGKEDRTIDPPLNAIFIEDDLSGPMPFAPGHPWERDLPQDKCYPHTNIPLSIDGIEGEAWKAVHPQNPSAKQVVIDFLTGQMAKGPFALHAETQAKRIESAFFELGWRVNRNALRQCNQDFKDNGITNAFGSYAWRRAPPLRVDNFKGEDIEHLMRGRGTILLLTEMRVIAMTAISRWSKRLYLFPKDAPCCPWLDQVQDAFLA